MIFVMCQGELQILLNHHGRMEDGVHFLVIIVCNVEQYPCNVAHFKKVHFLKKCNTAEAECVGSVRTCHTKIPKYLWDFIFGNHE